jgi:peptidoglycan hydrolase-like protein with peptidoglycan-binding domain
MKHTICRLLVILLICLIAPGLSLGETFHDNADLPDFSLTNYHAATDSSHVTVKFAGAHGYTYVLEHQYKGVWLASKSIQLKGVSGAISVDCLPGTNKFVLRNFGQSRNAKSSIAFTIKCTGATDTPDTVMMTTPTLRKGSKGTAVKALHQVLQDLGVYDGPLSTTFTQDTRKAVIEAQALFAITQDGVAGPQTLHMLDLKEYSIPASSIGGNSSGGTGTGTGTRHLEKGMRGDDVRKLQKRLKTLGYETGPIDGVFGDITYSAVILYQGNANIHQDGIVGPVTWGKLNNGAASLVPDPPQSNYLKKGSRGNAVTTVQARLIVLGYLNDDADGIFGKLTHAAVVAFQTDQGIKVDGIVGPVTYGRLFP